VPAQIAGTSFNVRITAQDVSNNTVASFTSTVVLTSGNATLSGTPVTSGSFINGVLASQPATITTTGGAVQLTATGSTKTGTAPSR